MNSHTYGHLNFDKGAENHPVEKTMITILKSKRNFSANHYPNLKLYYRAIVI